MRRYLPLLLALCITGCLILPTGARKLDPASRRPIPDDAVAAFRPGVATRTDVLLGLGAPEAMLDGDRLLLYQWSTASGLVVAQYVEAPLKTNFHDLVFEFDDSGLLVRSGDLKALLKDGWGQDRPLDLTAPIEIPVRLGGVVRREAWLLLERDALTLEESGRQPCCFRLPAGGAESFHYRPDRDGPEWVETRRYDLHARDTSGDMQTFEMLIEVRHLIPLAAYLRRHSPGIRFED